MKQRLQDIQDRIKKACDFAQRDPSEITLIAVTKNRNMEQIKPLMEYGITHFGENRVQEARDKWLGFNTDALTLHMIGPLQSNKVKQASEIFDVLHSLDRTSLIKEMVKYNWTPQIFCQINTGDEDQKAGVDPSDIAPFLSHVPFAVTGLMCIPPRDEPASLHFSLLNNLARQHALSNLSMGMSEDFEAAIKCGATHIRLGRILFDDL